jgi:HEAT repeat protein
MNHEVEFRNRLDELVQDLIHEGRDQTKALIAAVVSAGGTSQEALVRMLYDQSLGQGLRVDICWLIPRLQITGAEEILEPLLSDPSEKLREEAATALGLLPSDQAVDALLATLAYDTSKSVRAAAIHALGVLSPPPATDAILSVLQNPQEDEALRADAAEALAHFRREGLVDALVEQLRDTSPQVRYSVAYALGQQGDSRAIPSLTEVAARDHAATPWGSVASGALEAIDALMRNT